MADSDLFASDTGDDEDYDVVKDYHMKKKGKNISSSEDEAYADMGLTMKKKRRKLFLGPQPRPSHQAISSKDVESSDTSLSEDEAFDDIGVAMRKKRQKLFQDPQPGPSHQAISSKDVERFDTSLSEDEAFDDIGVAMKKKRLKLFQDHQPGPSHRAISSKDVESFDTSLSEDEAFYDIGVAMRKKRRKLFQDPQPGPSHQAISSKDVESFDTSLSKHEAFDDIRVAMRKKRRKLFQEPQPGPSHQGVEGSEVTLDEEPSTIHHPATDGAVDDSEDNSSPEHLTDIEINHMASAFGKRPLPVMLEKVNLSKEDQAEFLKLFENFATVPTPQVIEQYFEEKILEHKKEIEKLEEKRKICHEKATLFWVTLKNNQEKFLGRVAKSAVIARPRKKITPRLKKCPIGGCPGRVLNLNRHLSQCHKFLTKGEREEAKSLVKKIAEVKKAISKSPKKKQIKQKIVDYHRVCSVCDKSKKRVDVHLQKVHLLKRGTKQFMLALKNSKLINIQENPFIQTLETESGSVEISAEDSMKVFLKKYKEYLMKYTALADITIQKHVKMVADLLDHGLQNRSVSIISGSLICDIFESATSEDPPGYLLLKKDVFSASYTRKIICACKRALQCLKQEKGELKVPPQRYEMAERNLHALHVRFLKNEKKECFEREAKKKRDNIPISIIRKLLTSEYVKKQLLNAVKCLKDEKHRPVLVSHFISLRDTLITVFLVCSLRRIMEFSEFRLSEFATREPQFKEGTKDVEKVVVRISRHKTAEKGPSLVFLTQHQEEALISYMKFYRPLVVNCSSPNCYVFPSSSSSQTSKCCGKMCFSGLGKAVRRVARAADINEKITSRILRRSQITALWEKNKDPAWHSQVAELCSHSVHTARRYYEYSSKIKPGMEVVEELSNIRDDQEDSDKELSQNVKTVHPSMEESGEKSSQLLSDEERQDDHKLQEHVGEDNDAMPLESLHNQGDLAMEQAVEEHLLSNDGDKESFQHSESEFSKPFSELLPDDLSVGTILSTRTEGRGEDTLLAKPTPSKMYSDMLQAMASCNRSKDIGRYIVRWNEVREFLIKNDSSYAQFSAEQLRYKYKYLKKVKKVAY